MDRLLFVYGSLKRGFCHHRELAGAEFLGSARSRTGYRLVMHGQYPALLAGGSGVVHGELYRVSSALLAELDAFEGVPDLYQRTYVTLEDGREAACYAIDAECCPGGQEIAGGIWREPC